MDIRVSSNAAQVGRVLRALYADQVPFAAAKAVNQTAKDFQEAERKQLHSSFTLRRPDWAEKNVKIRSGEFATKRRPEAIVRMEAPGNTERSDILAKFEEEGTKTARGGKALSVPIDARRTKAGVVSRAQRLRTLQLKAVRTKSGKLQIKGEQRTFIVRGKDGRSYVFQRFGGKQGTRKGHRVAHFGHGNRETAFAVSRTTSLRLLYTFKKRVPIHERLHFHETAKKTVEERFTANMTQAFHDAVRTAR